MRKATIIIPCYNKEKYIKRALDSLVNLSRFEDFEVILVDDHSTDQTVNIIKEFEEKYENINLIVFETGSGSPSKPRNIGVERSTTDYVIFMDPDDIVINDGYSVLLSKMEEYDSDILIAARIGVTESGNKTFTDFIDEKYTYINSNDYDIKLDLLYRRPYILKTIYKKKLITENNIRFNEKITTSEDECFDTECMAYATKITKINDVVYQYTYEATGSVTTSVPMRIYEDLYEVITSLYKSYILIFDEETTISRIVNILQEFYFNRITFLNSTENVLQACSCLQKAINEFGDERINVLVEPDQIDFINDVKNGEFQSRLITSYINRLRVLSKRCVKLNKDNKKKDKKLVKLNQDLSELHKLLNRKIVIPGVWLAKKITAIKN